MQTLHPHETPALHLDMHGDVLAMTRHWAQVLVTKYVYLSIALHITPVYIHDYLTQVYYCESSIS